MNSSLRFAKTSLRILIFTPNAAAIDTVQKLFMSQYPNYYIKPVYNKNVQEELIKSGEINKLAHLPTRAALNDQSCSPAHDDLVNLFINYIMKDGQKILARELMETTLENIKRMQLEKYHKAKTEEGKNKIELNPKIIVHKAVENCKPILYLTPIKRGGVTYQVPMPLTDKKARFMSMKWLIAAGKEKESNVRFYVQFARELIDASNNIGRVIKKKHDLHRQCEANRAYAHYRWG